HDAAAARLPKVNGVLDDSGDADLRPKRLAARRPHPPLLQVAGKLGPGRAERAATKHLLNRGCRGALANQACALITAIDRRWSRGDMDAAADGLANRRLPTALDPLQLQFCDQRQDPDREATHRRRTVEVVLDTDKPGAGVGQPPDRGERVD